MPGEQGSHPPRAAVWLVAVRPQFLSVIVLTAALGGVLAWWHSGQIDVVLLLLTLLAAAAAQAGANVLNDYYDHLSGADALNTSPLSPYAGGSRVLQAGLLAPGQVRALGWSLTLLAAAIGLGLAALVGPLLLLIGGIGLALGYAYTAPPWSLSYRGYGELAIVLNFGPLTVGGAYLVQTGTLDWAVLPPGLALGVLAAAILYINQFPDHDADALAGKRTLVVRLGPARAARLSLLWPALAATVLLGAMLDGWAPWSLVPALLPLGLIAGFAWVLPRRLARNSSLIPVIQATIGGHAGFAVLLILGYVVDAG